MDVGLRESCPYASSPHARSDVHGGMDCPLCLRTQDGVRGQNPFEFSVWFTPGILFGTLAYVLTVVL